MRQTEKGEGTKTESETDRSTGERGTRQRVRQTDRGVRNKTE